MYHEPLALILAAVTAVAAIAFAVWAYFYDNSKGRFAALARRITARPQVLAGAGGDGPRAMPMARPVLTGQTAPDAVVELIVVEVV